MFLSVLRKYFSLFDKKKSYSRKTKIAIIFGNFLGKFTDAYLCKNAHCTVVYFDSKTYFFRITNTVCDLMHQ